MGEELELELELGNKKIETTSRANVGALRLLYGVDVKLIVAQASGYIQLRNDQSISQ